MKTTGFWVLVSESGNRDPVHRFPDSTLHVYSRGKNLRSLNRGIGDPKFHFESGCRVPRFPGSSVPRFPDSPVRFGSPGCRIPRLAGRTQLQCPWFPGSLRVHCCNVPGSPVRFGIPGCPIPGFPGSLPGHCCNVSGSALQARLPRFTRDPDSNKSPIRCLPRFPDSPVPRFTTPRFVPGSYRAPSNL